MSLDGNANIEAYNRTAIATNSGYVQTDLGIRSTDEETQNLTSATFGQIKRDPNAPWYAIGFSASVTRAYEALMNNPNTEINVGDKSFRPQSPVGNLRPYNESGNPSGGCFSLFTFA